MFGEALVTKQGWAGFIQSSYYISHPSEGWIFIVGGFLFFALTVFLPGAPGGLLILGGMTNLRLGSRPAEFE